MQAQVFYIREYQQPEANKMYDWKLTCQKRNEAIAERMWRKEVFNPLVITWVVSLAGFGLLEMALIAWGHL